MANCVFPGCGVQRIPKYEGIALFKLPSREGHFFQQWKEWIVQVILKYREADSRLKERIKNGKVHVCEKHFICHMKSRELAGITVTSINMSKMFPQGIV